MPEDVQTGTDTQPDNGPVTVQYPSGHTVNFPTEAHAQEHAASVWGQLKDEWNKVQNFQGFESPEGEDRKTGAQASPLGQSILDKVKDWHNEVSNTVEEAGASLGRLPAEVISGAKNFQALMPSPYGQKPSMESVEATGQREHPIVSGIGEGVGRTTGTLLSPDNIAIMAAMPGTQAIPLLNKALSLGFAAQMTKGVLRDATSLVQNWDKMTPQQRTSALTSGSLQTVMAGLATIHAHGGKIAVPAELKNELGEATVPGTGTAVVPAKVGSAEAAAADTRYFQEARNENPEGTFSDWARIAQEKKMAAVSPERRVVERQTPERRINPQERKRVADMSHEELRQELLTSKTTGIPNRRAFEEAEHEPANAVAMSDADGLKALNDKFGYAAGDALLRAKAEALQEAGLDAYHDKGDEFLYRGGSPADLQQKLEKAREILRNREIQVDFKDGATKTFKGADFSYGTGENITDAESGLKEHKAAREAKGERARGELRGISEVEPKANQGNTSASAPTVTKQGRVFYHGANAEGAAAIDRTGKISPAALTQAHLTPSKTTAEAYAKANGGKVYSVKAKHVPSDRLSHFDTFGRGPIVIREGDTVPAEEVK